MARTFHFGTHIENAVAVHLRAKGAHEDTNHTYSKLTTISQQIKKTTFERLDMLIISENLLRQLDALNNWLSDAYGEETDFNTLLTDSGFTDAEVERIKQKHLHEFLHAVIDLMDCSTDQRKWIMVQHYGLIDGKPQDFYVLGDSAGVCGERIRQLVTRRLDFYRDPKQQKIFQNDFATIGRQLLDNEGNSQSI